MVGDLGTEDLVGGLKRRRRVRGGGWAMALVGTGMGMGRTSLENSITSSRLWTRSSWVSSAVSSPRAGSTGKSVRPSSNCQGGGP